MATGCQFRTDLRANFVGEICHAGEIRSIFPVGILRNFDRQISFHFGFHPPETENLKEKMPKTNILEEVSSSRHHLINYVGGFHAPQLKVWNSNLASVEQRSHNSSYGISLLDFTVQWCCLCAAQCISSIAKHNTITTCCKNHVTRRKQKKKTSKFFNQGKSCLN